MVSKRIIPRDGMNFQYRAKSDLIKTVCETTVSLQKIWNGLLHKHELSKFISVCFENMLTW